ncbi:polysaccharide deacetylase family protein [Pelagibius sp. CAU 1746]|uniref:polysaccharide deacetylase family protein n=1 Tax=Pelagibius sp. CAU 1746 TaxID=3140370 RepID=UPI00325A4B84
MTAGTTEHAAWTALETELDAWAAAGRAAEVWWRDDDAAAPSPALERLLELAARQAAPLALAVIPAKAEDALARLLDGRRADIAVFQHGFAHANHAGGLAQRGAKKCELVDPAARPAVLDELRRGRESLSRRFGRRFLPVLVPPWNRIAAALLPRLPDLGFTGLSCYQARAAAEAAPGLTQVNCHLDLMQWRPERRFLGAEAALGLLSGHLAAKREGRADPGEPSGILSHHAVHDGAAWDFLGELLARLAGHRAVRLAPPAAVFTREVAG